MAHEPPNNFGTSGPIIPDPFKEYEQRIAALEKQLAEAHTRIASLETMVGGKAIETLNDLAEAHTRADDNHKGMQLIGNIADGYKEQRDHFRTELLERNRQLVAAQARIAELESRQDAIDNSDAVVEAVQRLDAENGREWTKQHELRLRLYAERDALKAKIAELEAAGTFNEGLERTLLTECHNALINLDLFRLREGQKTEQPIIEQLQQVFSRVDTYLTALQRPAPAAAAKGEGE